MGKIYKLTSPAGKSYIGQTIRDLNHRLKQHEYSVNYEKCGCFAIKAAIKKYGFINFIVEILIECPNDELDYWEVKFIDEHNTLSPNGYNLTKGGANRITNHTEEEKDKISSGQRKYKDGIHDLPRYMSYIDSQDHGIGLAHPDKPYSHFTSKVFTLNEKFNLALRYLDFDDHEEIKKEYHEIKRLRKISAISKEKVIDGDTYILPSYFVYYEKRKIFIVRKPSFPTKEFGGQSKTTAEKYQLALSYYNSLN